MAVQTGYVQIYYGSNSGSSPLSRLDNLVLAPNNDSVSFDFYPSVLDYRYRDCLD